MPYVKQKVRDEYEKFIEVIISSAPNMALGTVNYIISRLIWSAFNGTPTYDHGNNLRGVLKCVSDEFYRRKMVPLEQDAIDRNGDLPEA